MNIATVILLVLAKVDSHLKAVVKMRLLSGKKLSNLSSIIINLTYIFLQYDNPI
jgi:hypothetical protein